MLSSLLHLELNKKIIVTYKGLQFDLGSLGSNLCVILFLVLKTAPIAFSLLKQHLPPPESAFRLFPRPHQVMLGFTSFWFSEQTLTMRLEGGLQVHKIKINQFKAWRFHCRLLNTSVLTTLLPMWHFQLHALCTEPRMEPQLTTATSALRSQNQAGILVFIFSKFSKEKQRIALLVGDIEDSMYSPSKHFMKGFIDHCCLYNHVGNFLTVVYHGKHPWDSLCTAWQIKKINFKYNSKSSIHNATKTFIYMLMTEI